MRPTKLIRLKQKKKKERENIYAILLLEAIFIIVKEKKMKN